EVPLPIELELGSSGIFVELITGRARHSAAATFHIALLDASERRRAEADRLRAALERERLNREHDRIQATSEAKDRFLAVLSHELRTPLTPALLMLDALDIDPGSEEARQHHLQIIRRNLLMEARLVDDLLDLSLIERGK